MPGSVVFALSLLHFVPDDAEVSALVQALRAAMAPGSYPVLSHASYDHADRETMARLEALYACSGNAVQPRPLATIASSICRCGARRGRTTCSWTQPERVFSYAGVGRKP